MPSLLARARAWNFDIDRYCNAFVTSNQARRLPRPIAHFLGYRKSNQKDVGNVLLAIWSCVGAFLSILIMESIFMIPAIHDLNPPLMIASFGAAAILQYNTIASPLAQPRNVFVGELLATALGIAITKLFLLLPHAPLPTDINASLLPSSSLSSPYTSDPHSFENLRFLAGALAVGLSSALMTLTKTVYPPAGATALLAAIDPRCTNLGWWLLPLAMLSTVVNMLVGLVINNLQRQWPLWWWTNGDVGRRRTHAEGGADPAGMGGLPIVQGVEVTPQREGSVPGLVVHRDVEKGLVVVDVGMEKDAVGARAHRGVLEKTVSEASTITLGLATAAAAAVATAEEKIIKREEEAVGSAGSDTLVSRDRPAIMDEKSQIGLAATVAGTTSPSPSPPIFTNTTSAASPLRGVTTTATPTAPPTMEIKPDRISLPSGLELTDSEREVLDEVRRRMRVMQMVASPAGSPVIKQA